MKWHSLSRAQWKKRFQVIAGSTWQLALTAPTKPVAALQST
jgi:hypothetical protein